MPSKSDSRSQTKSRRSSHRPPSTLSLQETTAKVKSPQRGRRHNKRIGVSSQESSIERVGQDSLVSDNSAPTTGSKENVHRNGNQEIMTSASIASEPQRRSSSRFQRSIAIPPTIGPSQDSIPDTHIPLPNPTPVPSKNHQRRQRRKQNWKRKNSRPCMGVIPSRGLSSTAVTSASNSDVDMDISAQEALNPDLLLRPRTTSDVSHTVSSQFTTHDVKNDVLKGTSTDCEMQNLEARIICHLELIDDRLKQVSRIIAPCAHGQLTWESKLDEATNVVDNDISSNVRTMSPSEDSASDACSTASSINEHTSTQLQNQSDSEALPVPPRTGFAKWSDVRASLAPNPTNSEIDTQAKGKGRDSGTHDSDSSATGTKAARTSPDFSKLGLDDFVVSFDISDTESEYESFTDDENDEYSSDEFETGLGKRKLTLPRKAPKSTVITVSKPSPINPVLFLKPGSTVLDLAEELAALSFLNCQQEANAKDKLEYQKSGYGPGPSGSGSGLNSRPGSSASVSSSSSFVSAASNLSTGANGNPTTGAGSQGSPLASQSIALPDVNTASNILRSRTIKSTPRPSFFSV